MFESSTAESSPAPSTNGAPEKKMVTPTPTRPRTHEDLFAAIHRYRLFDLNSCRLFFLTRPLIFSASVEIEFSSSSVPLVLPPVCLCLHLSSCLSLFYPYSPLPPPINHCVTLNSISVLLLPPSSSSNYLLYFHSNVSSQRGSIC